MKTFCTICSGNYLSYGLALYESLLKFDKNVSLNILISDNQEYLSNYTHPFPNLKFYFTEDLCDTGYGKQLYEKYFSNDINCFRWSMKSVFIKYLLQKQNFDKVIFTDSDIFFFHDYNFLFNELESNDVLITPHWRTSNPNIDAANFITLYTSGLYNGGFFAANKNAIAALDWWSMSCVFTCEKNRLNGQFGDQSHLNLLPIYFDNVKIIKHRGCNVANWNLVECKRTKTNDTILINNEYPIVFIHFTNSTIRGIESGEDKNLEEFLDIYKSTLLKHGRKILNEPTQPKLIKEVPKPIKQGFFKKMKQKLRIRTRIKKFLHG